MVKVYKLNVYLSIKEEEVDLYLKKGFKKVEVKKEAKAEAKKEDKKD